jgi:hypothetical protein
MEACEVVRLFVNKAIVSAQPKRRGNPGYGRLKALRVLVYSRLKGLENDTRVVEHLKKNRSAAKTFGLNTVPDRTTVGRWWRRYLGLLEEIFEKIADILQLVTPTTFLLLTQRLLQIFTIWKQTGVTRVEENSEASSSMQPSTKKGCL